LLEPSAPWRLRFLEITRKYYKALFPAQKQLFLISSVSALPLIPLLIRRLRHFFGALLPGTVGLAEGVYSDRMNMNEDSGVFGRQKRPYQREKDGRMKVVREESIRNETLRGIAEKMLIAARTAPKACGDDNLELALADAAGIKEISDQLKEMERRYGVPLFGRDAENILRAEVLVLMGTKIKSMGLKKCSMCGFNSCEEKNRHPEIPCVFNTGDLGIAMGSAVSVAADHRADNRIMYTVGQAVLALGLLGPEVKVAYGIPLSASPKNPFFDRK